MAESLIKCGLEAFFDSDNGKVSIGYDTAYKVLTIIYTKNSHRYQIHFAPEHLNYFIDDVLQWSK